MSYQFSIIQNKYTAIITVLITAISTMFGYHVVNFVNIKN